MARCYEKWAVFSATPSVSAKAHPFLPALAARLLRTISELDGHPGTCFFKHRDFHSLLWEGVSAHAGCLFNSQGTGRASEAQVAVSLHVHEKEILEAGLDLLLSRYWHYCWRHMGLRKVFSGVTWVPWVSGVCTVAVALLEGSTWDLITRQ